MLFLDLMSPGSQESAQGAPSQGDARRFGYLVDHTYGCSRSGRLFPPDPVIRLMPRGIVQVLGKSSGGIRRLVRYLAENPPSGYETAGVVGPGSLAGYFEDFPFRALAGFRPWAPLKPDLLHAHGFTAAGHAVVSENLNRFADWGRAPEEKRQGWVPVVVTVHTAPAQTLRAGAGGGRQRWVQRLLWRAGRMVAERSDALIAPSEDVANGLRGAVIIPPAIDMPVAEKGRAQMREILGTPPDVVVVLAVGRLHPDKALHVFIESVAGTGAEGWIAGEGPERARLEQLAAGSGVRLLGQRSDVGSLMGAADVFALPASGEAYGFAVLEAISAGLPVVATRTGAIPEIAGDAAILVEPGDRQGFVEATHKLIEDPGARKSLAEKARRRELPSPLDLVARVGLVYDKVCGAFLDGMDRQ